MKKPTRPPHSCGKCDARWWGMAMAHCRGCCTTFTGITAFAAHRVGPTEGRTCDLSKLSEVRSGIYGQPGDVRAFESAAGVQG